MYSTYSCMTIKDEPNASHVILTIAFLRKSTQIDGVLGVFLKCMPQFKSNKTSKSKTRMILKEK